MPVRSFITKMGKNNNEKVIKIHREQEHGFPGSTNIPVPTTNSNQEQQQSSRTWSQQSSYSTKRVVQNGSTEPHVTETSKHSTSKSSDLFSNAHNSHGNDDTKFVHHNSPQPRDSATNDSIKSSSLVNKAMQEFNDDFNHIANNMRKSSLKQSSTHTSSSSQHFDDMLPGSTPTMEIVPSSRTDNSSNSMVLHQNTSNWSMGTDAQGDVPVTYEIVNKPDGTKEFQLLLTASGFSPEDLQVKITDNKLFISGSHEERSPSGAFSSKSFYRSCTIPYGVRPEDLNCSLDSSGRLKISAPVPDQGRRDSSSSSQHHKTTKTITNNQASNWHDTGMVPSGFRIAPGQKEHVMTVFDQDDQDLRMFGSNGSKPSQDSGMTTTKKVQTSSTKTVKTFKTVA